MLTGNAWRRSVGKALTLATVTGDALSEKRRPMLRVGHGTQSRLIFGACWRCGSRNARQKQQQKRRAYEQHLQGS
jgi:hypothetical protein